jgi:beta-lactamase regulating signal transducer with metallopeptidase domain
MNDLGITLAWVAVQVGVLLVPALLMNALTARRRPAAGAWVAGLSLGLVVALNGAAFVPGVGWTRLAIASKVAPPIDAFEQNRANAAPSDVANVTEPVPAARPGSALVWLRVVWDRLGRGATEPVVRARRWGSTLAAVALAGTAAGSLRLMIGLWAVAICCRRGRPIDDPDITGLLDELQTAMGWRRPVALREVPGLSTPATSGRRRPVVLLPDNWRSWSAAELRAVLAHELAHIVRGDYAMGLLARVAVTLNFYHPLVRLMAGRLQLQQEQAADAMGAQFAGGTACYLVALSSMALRQDGRSACWPARAFLPPRGTLIRRITMLRNECGAKSCGQPLSRAGRMTTFLTLLGLAIATATIRAPVRGGDDGPTAAIKPELQPHPAGTMFISELAPYVRKGMDGVALIRPAAAFRHNGMDRLLALCEREFGENLAQAAKELKVDTNRPGFLKIRCQDIEWLTVGVGFGRRPLTEKAKKKAPGAADADTEPLHTIMFGTPVIRMLAPFDWVAFARQWRCEFEEARVNGRLYYKITGLFTDLVGKNACFFMPDDRTVFFDEENVIRAIAGGQNDKPPEYLRGQEWERASRGLVAVAINNGNDGFAKRYDLGRPDDKMVLSIFKGLDTWILGIDDADSIVFHADGACRTREATESINQSLNSLIKLGQQYNGQEVPQSDDASHDVEQRIVRALAAGARVEHTENTVTVRAQGLGTLSDFAKMIERYAGESKDRAAARDPAKTSVTR